MPNLDSLTLVVLFVDATLLPAAPVAITLGRVINRRFDARRLRLYVHAGLLASVAGLVLQAITRTAHPAAAQ